MCQLPKWHYCDIVLKLIKYGDNKSQLPSCIIKVIAYTSTFYLLFEVKGESKEKKIKVKKLRKLR